MKVLIIGSGGFIGRHLLNYMTSKGIDVCGVSSADGNGIEPNTGNLSEKFFIPPGTDAVVYLAQSPYYRQVPEMAPHLLNVNVVSVVKVAQMARREKVSRFIYASTGNVYAPSFKPLAEDAPLCRDNWYSLSKIYAEEALALFRNDMDITIVRPFGIYGDGQTNKLVPKLIKSVLEGRNICIEKNPNEADDLDGLKISFCYIDDAVKILTELISYNQYKFINMAGFEVVSIRKLVNIIGEILLGNQPIIEIKEQYRNFDLIADISLVQKLNHEFTTIEVGIKQTIEYSRLQL